MTEPATVGTAIRDVPLSRLALAPENVRKTAPDAADQQQLQASILAHGLLENLVARIDTPADDGTERFAVVAGGRRLVAMQALARAGELDPDHPVPCKIATETDGAEISLAENTVRIAMHPADQVVAFSALAATGATVAAIAARFGVSERTVERRLALGNAAPVLLDAYRADEIDLATLQAFAVTTDHQRQQAVWAQVSAQGYRPTAWQVRGLITDGRVPGASAIARFIGAEAYEAAGGAVIRDLFADDDQNGTWFEDPALLQSLAKAKLQEAADELATRWKWASPMIDVGWNDTARYGRIHPEPAEPTPEEQAEIERLRTRHDEIVNMDEEDWTEDLDREADAIEPRLEEIDAQIQARARFQPQDVAIAGCIVTVGDDGALEVIQGLVKPEDMPKQPDPAADTAHTDSTAPAAAGPVRVDAPDITRPAASPVDPRAQARADAGVGIGLADDLRAIRNALVKAHLATDFEAAFDLALFQMARSVFHPAYRSQALEIAVQETPDRPNVRGNDDTFGEWSPGEAMLADRSHLSFDWLEIDDDGESFAALRALSTADKQQLFAAAVARTVKGQLAFEHGARPELEATVARLDIDFAEHVRPTADMLWSRIKKSRILEIARETLGAAWASARSKYKKPELAKAMEDAFAAGAPPAGLSADDHKTALAWTMPGFAPFDAATPDAPEEPEAKPAPATAADPVPAPADPVKTATAPAGAAPVPDTRAPSPELPEPLPQPATTADGPAPVNGHDAFPAAHPGTEAESVPEFLRRVH